MAVGGRGSGTVNAAGRPGQVKSQANFGKGRDAFIGKVQESIPSCHGMGNLRDSQGMADEDSDRPARRGAKSEQVGSARRDMCEMQQGMG